MEGLFFAVGSSRALLAPLGDLAMGMMNERYNPNCPGNAERLLQLMIDGIPMRLIFAFTNSHFPCHTFKNAEIVSDITVSISLLVAMMAIFFSARQCRRTAPYFLTIDRSVPPIARNALHGSQSTLPRSGICLLPSLFCHHSLVSTSLILVETSDACCMPGD